MANPLTLGAGLEIQPLLILPLLLAFWIGWKDLKTRRIPNYLNLAVALSGLAFQTFHHGWGGLSDGFLGLLLGFGLLFLPYLLGGIGAGDVKALAALGAWLGPSLILYLFVYMGLCGALIALAAMCWNRTLWSRIRYYWNAGVNWLLCCYHGVKPAAASKSQSQCIPYGAAMALGMVVLFFRGV